jgi:DNA-binding LacI/PurR family transcriptional regulator
LDDQPAPVEAVIGHNDSLALCALRALQAIRKRVPQDIAVIGFDNTAEGQAVTPPLTTIQPSYHDMGQHAVEMLLTCLKGTAVPEQVVLPGKLVVRESCECLAPIVDHAAVKRRQGDRAQDGKILREFAQSNQ